MASRRHTERNLPTSRRPPATTPQERENQVISSAIDLAEAQILEGTASAQVITHYLKLGSSRETLEKEKLARENELLQAKIEHLQSGQRIEELYAEAIKAMSRYRGEEEYEDLDD